MRVAFAAAVLAVAGLAIAGTRAIRAQEVPPLSSHVNDYADMIGADAQQAIDDRLAKLEADTGAQVVVLTVPSLEGGSLEELAQKLEGVNGEQLLKTIAEYNRAVRTDIPFNPNVKDGRRTEGLAVDKSNWANTIDQPPFEGYAVTCGLTFTFGGLRITNDGEVVNTDYEPIRGLYAAGELVGGLFYFNYPGSSGLMAGSVFGRIAGSEAAAHARSRLTSAA